MQINFVAMLLSRYYGIPYETTHASKNIHVAAVVVILKVSTNCVSFEYLSKIITTCWLPFAAMDSEPKISIATDSDGQL